MTAKQYLSQYRALDARINAKLAQAERIRQLARAAGSNGNSSGVHSSQPYDKVGELTAKIVDLENEINGDINALVDLEREIRECISKIPNANHRAVLELKYINGFTLKQIADKLNYSLVNIKKIHKCALESVYPIIPLSMI